MTIDLIEANPCPDFCSEMCEVGVGEYATRHKSSGTLATVGGRMGNDELNASNAVGIDLVPSVAVAQKLGGKPAEVVLRVDMWIRDRARGWTSPSELNALVQEHSMTPDRAEYLGKLLIEAALTAREVPLSADRVTA